MSIIKNKYFQDECNARIKPLIEFSLLFGNKGSVDNQDVEQFLKKYVAEKTYCGLQVEKFTFES